MEKNIQDSDIFKDLRIQYFVNKQSNQLIREAAILLKLLVCRSRILAVHLILLSLNTNSHVVAFQGHVICRFYPLEGPVYLGNC